MYEYEHATKDCRAELIIFCRDGLFDFNTRYVRDAHPINDEWEPAGIYPSIHDALEVADICLKAAEKEGLRRGNTINPWKNPVTIPSCNQPIISGDLSIFTPRKKKKF